MPSQEQGSDYPHSTDWWLQHDPRDTNFPPPPAERLVPSLRGDLSWARRNLPSASAQPGASNPAPPRSGRQILDYLTAIRDSHAESNETETPRSRQRSRQQADRDFQAEYESLLSEFHSPGSDNIFNPTPTSAVRFLEQQQSIHSDLAQISSLMTDRQGADSSNNHATSPASQGETERRRPRRSVASRSLRNHHAYLTGEEEEDLDVVRAMWNRRAQHTSSPFSPPHPSTVFPAMSPGQRSQDHAEDDRRSKRRKLDSDRVAPSFRGFRYGKYGQVEPGELAMEIVSCDGGLYSNESTYACENILINDSTVYCTKSSRCNIVLRHQGATVFSLKELVIKAPGSNSYSSPVREGMIFVSMNQDDFLTRTAQYQIQYAAASGHSRGRDSRPLAPIISVRHNQDGSIVTRTQARSRRLYGLNADDDEDEDQRMAQIPYEFTAEPPPFNVTTECSDGSDGSDGSDDDETPRVPISRRAPNRIGSLPFESESSDESNPFAQDEYGFYDAWAPASRRRDTQNMTLVEALDASQNATQEAIRAVGGGGAELMAPYAKFFIEKDRSKCTIRFDPPVSGRFILLKMWSPHRDSESNIDIQAIVAKGFAGPRYFPSVQLR